MTVSNLHQGVLAGAAQPTGAVFDSTLIGNSIWLEGAGTSGDAATRTWGTESNQDRWIWATWYQPLREIDATGDRNNLFASGGSANGFYLNHTSTASTFNVFHRDNAGTEGAITTTESYRDLTSWIHVLVDYDSANAYAEDRISLYVNGVRTGVNSGNRPGQNNHLNTNVSGQTARIGQDLSTTPNYHVKGYLAQTIFLDNKSIANGDLALTDFLDTFTFGTNGSQIIPKADADIIALASAAGNNSFCLDYSDASNIVNDASTKNNHFTAVSSSITSANQSVHTPSKVYPVMNPLDQDPSTSTTLSEGNLKVSMSTAAGDGIRGTLPYSGKIYWEVEIDSISSNSGSNIGIATNNHNLALTADDTSGNGQRDAFVGVSSFSSNLVGFISGSNFDSSYGGLGNNFGTAGKYLMFAVDIAAGKFWAGYDGTWFNSGNPAAGSNDSGKNLALYDKWFPAISRIGSAGSEAFIFNFGQSSFAHTPPSGFQSLNSSTLTAPDYQGIDYFDSTIYEGTGGGQRVGDFVPFTDAYDVSNSVIFDDGSSAFLSRTPSGAGNKRTWTWSVWVKRSAVGTEQELLFCGPSSSDLFQSQFNTDDTLNIEDYDGSSQLQRTTNRAFKDTSQWIHLVFVFDTTQSAAADRFKLYVNGQQETSFASSTNPSLNYEGRINAATETTIGKKLYVGSAKHLDGYMAESVFIDGTALTPSSFGQTDTSTNRWIPKDVSGLTFGTNGFYLDMAIAPGTGNGAGNDVSGNNNDFTESGFAAGDQSTDSPTKNYATLSQITGLTPTGTASGPAVMSDGNLRMNITGTSNGNSPSHTPSEAFAIQEGKWYFEVEAVTIGQAWNIIGLTDVDDYQQQTLSGSGFIDDAEPGQWGYLLNAASTSPDAIIADGTFLYGSDSPYNGVSNHKVDTGDVLGVHIERTRNTYKMWFSRNGTHYLRNTTQLPIIEFGTRGRVIPFARTTNGTGNRELHFNFGQQLVFDGSSTTFDSASGGYWKNAPASGYKALNQDNLDATASKLTAWAWIKNRDSTDSHILVDRVRGIQKVMHSDSTDAETTEVNTVQRFLQRGVQIGNDVQVNTVNESYVLWQWLVGTSASTGSTTSPAGTIASTSIAADADHFSIVTYTGNQTSGATFGHGLGGAPEMVIVKERDPGGNNWKVGHDAMGWSAYAAWDTSAAQVTGATAHWNDTAPSSTLVTLGNDTGINATGATYVAYCFRSVPGVCKVGSYVGNSDADGPFIELGFKPAWLMIKRITAVENWFMFDNKRDVDNPAEHYIMTDATNAENDGSGGNDVDFLANGFKLRSNNAGTNAASEYIYLAMADIAGNGTLPPIYGR
jgi:hypothetical protein